jgi:hypothetical protein
VHGLCSAETQLCVAPRSSWQAFIFHLASSFANNIS